jgi:CHAT domain-containing protein
MNDESPERGPIHPQAPGAEVDEEIAEHLAMLTERDIVRTRREVAPGHGLLAVGGVDFGRPDQDGDGNGPLAGARFHQLPATSLEASAVAELWASAAGQQPEDAPVLLIGPHATEGAVKRLLPGRRSVHLATHGFFLGDPASGVPGARSISGLSERRPASEPVLTLSGLALAGANHRAADGEEDGILTAEEIVAMDLSGVQWAVLSACDTGVGTVQSGEGVLGLRRAFEVSGVASLVMSLWDVDDRATRHWMEDLYRSRFRDGLSTVESLRNASRSALARSRERLATSHPFYWGAFVAVGEWK